MAVTIHEFKVAEIERLKAENKMLLGALRDLRFIVKESTGTPRYTVIAGAALNSVIEEVVDPCLRSFDG